MSSAAEKDILQLKSSLEKALKIEGYSDISDILRALNALPISSELLLSTKIAVSVNEAKKKVPSSESCFELAKELLKKWKKIYDGKAVKEPTKPVEKTVKKSAEAVIKPSASLDAEEEMEFDKLSPARRQAMDLFKAHLKQSTNEHVAEALAFHIESSIHEMLPYHEDSKAYASKVRSLASNLKRNEVKQFIPFLFPCF